MAGGIVWVQGGCPNHWSLPCLPDQESHGERFGLSGSCHSHEVL